MPKALMTWGHGTTLASGDEAALVGLLNLTGESAEQYSATEGASFTGLRGGVSTGGSGTNTFRFRDTGANGQNVASVAGPGTFEDTTHTDVLTAGDLFNIAYTDTGTDSVMLSSAINVEFASGHGNFHGASGASGLIFDVGSATRYLPINGILAADGTATIANAQFKVREYTSLEAFQVRVTANARLNNSVFSVNVNGSDVGTAITYATLATGLQSVTGMAIALSPGDLVCISLVLGAGVEDLTLAFVGATLKSTANSSAAGYGIMAGRARTASATPEYYSFGGGAGPTEANTRVKVGFSARCTNLRCYISANTYTGNATLSLFVNGVAKITQTITAGAANQWFENTSDVFDIGPTDTLGFEIVGGTANSATIHQILISFEPSKQPPRTMHVNRMRRAA